ncbi:4'-phosphopantetheinyl transferase superfamily protein [Streptomyces sp. NPDC006355]|uniref:4'-phosphopantetheinyl transferase family protein n=1 Tax=Streptomyces sp. NPDC006355 TaxID=3156758 RepID=UPI0033B96EF3
MTAHAVRISPPFEVSGSRGPWHGVCESVRLTGNATVLTTWEEWLDAVLAGGGLREMLGRDWQRYRRIPDPAVRHRFAASRLAVKYTAAAALGTAEPVELDLAYAPGGRPYVRGFGQLDVSLTHSEDLIVVGVSLIGRIGVDAESAHARPPAEAFLGHTCTAAERTELGSLSEAEQHRALVRLWTLKEAYSKALGQGLPLGFTEFGFTACEECRNSADSARCALLCAPDGTPVENDTWAFATHRVLGGRYLVSVACQDTGVGTVPGPTVTASLDETVLCTVADRLSRQYALADPLETHVLSSVHLGVGDRGSPRQDR